MYYLYYIVLYAYLPKTVCTVCIYTKMQNHRRLDNLSIAYIGKRDIKALCNLICPVIVQCNQYGDENNDDEDER